MKNAYSQEINSIFSERDSSPAGLSQQEATKRLSEYGPNLLPKAKPKPLLVIFLQQFSNPFIYVLLFASVISIFGSHLLDAAIILFIICVSAVVGLVQEYKADRSLAALQKIITSQARVVRSGREQIIKQEEIVPGDILIVKGGDKVLADARIIEAHNLEVNEAVLTGESLPVNNKNVGVLPLDTSLADRTNMLFSGTIVEAGHTKALVTATGQKTEIGKIAQLLSDTDDAETPLQKQLLAFGKKMAIALVFLNILIFLGGIIAQKPLYEMLLTSVALVVSVIPEGILPATSIILALGMQKLVKQNGLVRKMLAAETLGSVTVICSDKTGTLTTGEMTLAHIIPADESISNRDIFKFGILCNDALIKSDDGKTIEAYGNPTDKALLIAAKQNELDKEILERLEPKVNEIPFSSTRKFMATLRKSENEKELILYVKGAPEKILARSRLSDENREIFYRENERITESGYRVLAIARKSLTCDFNAKELVEETINDLDFLGLVAFKDPIRGDARQAIELCHQAGIRPVILTGDHKKTAVSVCGELGLKVDKDSILEGKDLDQISFQDLCQIVPKITLFARVEPKHKIQIVSALQCNGEIVAMTGDGINDSPALKKADIGVAVGSGTEIAKETADLVLLDDNFMTIVEAVKRGRIIFNNLRKVIMCLLIDSCSEMVVVTGSIILGLALPILPVQILWVKLVEDTFPAISLSFEELEEDVMKDPPRKKNEPLLNGSFVKLIVFYAVIMDATLLGLFCFLNEYGSGLAHARTMIFVGLGITSLAAVFSIRTIKHHVWQVDPLSNKMVVYGSVISILLYILAIYTPLFNKFLKTVPLSLHDWGLMVLYALFSILIYELCKKFTLMKFFAGNT